MAELRVGVLLSRGKGRAARQEFLDDLVGTIPIIDYDLEVASAHAELLVEVRRQGAPRGAHDLIIAATARAHGGIVVTADAAAFANLSGVEVRAYR